MKSIGRAGIPKPQSLWVYIQRRLHSSLRYMTPDEFEVGVI